MNLLAAPEEEGEEEQEEEEEEEGEEEEGDEEEGKRKNGMRRTCCNQFLLIILYTVYLNYVEVAGLDYEKVWYKVLGQVIYHRRAKQWNLKLYFWNYKKKT